LTVPAHKKLQSVEGYPIYGVTLDQRLDTAEGDVKPFQAQRRHFLRLIQRQVLQCRTARQPKQRRLALRLQKGDLDVRIQLALGQGEVELLRHIGQIFSEAEPVQFQVQRSLMARFERPAPAGKLEGRPIDHGGKRRLDVIIDAIKQVG